jgi:hypothetical protein
MPNRLAAALVSLALASCYGANWKFRKQVEGYALPRTIPIVIGVTPEVAQADQGQYVATFVSTLRSRLDDKGIRTQAIDGNKLRTAPPVPRVEIYVRSWDEGDQDMRALLPYPAGEAEMVLDCLVVSGQNQHMFYGRLKAYQGGHGIYDGGGDAKVAAGEAADAVAEAITQYNQ